MADNHTSKDDVLTRILSASAAQIWAAGLGALTLAEREGTRVFDSLSKLGETLQDGGRKTASAASQTVTGARDTALETRDKLEQIFEQRVSNVLNTLQIPTARDIGELSARVEKLQIAVDQLNIKKHKADKKAKPKKAKNKKTARKKAQSKKKKSKAKKSSGKKQK